MNSNSRVSVAQRLAIEKQLLREEKYIVHALKTVKEERYALQREGTDLLCRLKEVLRQGMPKNADGISEENTATSVEPSSETIETVIDSQTANVTNTNSLLAEFHSAGLDEVVSNEVELNLTVPSHKFYDETPEEEFEEIENEDDFEIEMSMLMNGGGDKPNE